MSACFSCEHCGAAHPHLSEMDCLTMAISDPRRQGATQSYKERGGSSTEHRGALRKNPGVTAGAIIGRFIDKFVDGLLGAKKP